ncbi:sulfur carrier protein ThiS [Bradyrhizobium sp. 2TAF24]|uniref:sulfur carrier protein ThiS n=1 Tax=Bradyrhizobium sp. 2TAF24 TaxID=3233011 RepID=UPI003F910C12
MFLIVNGERTQTQATRVDALLGELDYTGNHLAVAVNYDVVPRSRWAETTLNDGDQVEILTPRQGG